MGQSIHYDEDSYRLPDGMVRTGYDADTERYTFCDVETEETYVGAPGVEYGPVQLVLEDRPPSRLLADGNYTNNGVTLDLEPFILRPIQPKKSAPLLDGLRRVKHGTLPGAFRSLRRSLTSGGRRRRGPELPAGGESEARATAHISDVATDETPTST